MIKKTIKASLTVEASFVITMTIFVCGIMMSLWIYKFQECWYTQGGVECLLTGSNKAVLNQEDYLDDIKQKWERIKNENYLIPQELDAQIVGNKDNIIMTVNGKTPVWGLSPLKISIEQKIKIVKPVTYIRKITAVREVMEE